MAAFSCSGFVVRSLVLLLALTLGWSAQAAPARNPCGQLSEIIASQQARIAALQQQTNRLEQLLAGQIDDDFILGEVIDVPLDIEADVKDAKLQWARKRQSLQPASLAEPLRACGSDSQRWQSQADQLLALERLHQDRVWQLLDSPKAQRLALVRGTNQWLIMANIQKQLVPTPTDSADMQASYQAIQQWIDGWRAAFRAWLPTLMQSTAAHEELNTRWEETLVLPRPAAAIDWTVLLEPAQTGTTPSAPLLWLEAMEEARIALRVEAGRWRNRLIREWGWRGFFADMTQPLRFALRLTEEITSAPRNLVDSVTRPFIREYRRALRTDNLLPLLSFWIIQSVTLLGIFWLLVRLAAIGPRHLSSLQQKLITQFPDGMPARVITALFWIIKPNAAWLVVLTGSAICLYLVQEEWYILSWVGPLGMLYASVRAVRIALEWLMSRSYTRYGQFISSPIADQLSQDVQYASWFLVVAWLSRWLVLATGGGYSYFLTIVLNAVIIWWVLQWLLQRHADSIARFLLASAHRKPKTAADLQAALRWSVRLFWPLLFVIAHLYDLLLRLNQHLMIFDSYRTLSVKLLRMRLEAIEEERDSEEEEPDAPDQNYSDWLLRELRSSDAIIEAADNSYLLTPIRQWFAERSDDNVLLVVGDQGSGKTTLVKQLSQIWQETPVTYMPIPPKTLAPDEVLALVGNTLKLPSCSSIAELVSQDAGLPPQIVVVDNTHNLFLSEVGKLDAYRRFIQCLNAHLSNVFWVVVMHGPSWTYLDCVFNREQRFTHVYRMRKWTPGDIRKLILSRHQGSRRRLRYDELLLSASAGSESSSVRAADSRVFNIIWEQSAGNPLVALHLWLAAARTRDRVVEIGVPQKPAAAALNSLNDDACFILATIITHKSLNSYEIMEATNYAEPIVRHAIKQGMNLGLLWRSEDKRYGVHPAWQQTLAAHLTRKNMLWTR